jgi:hypothetical protein
VSCSELSLAGAEPLAGTATTARRWLLVEVRGAWGRDAVPDTALPDAVREMLATFDGRVLLIRRPDRRHGVTVVRAESAEDGGWARRAELERLDDVTVIDAPGGIPLEGPLVLVCAHGRRDACCARLGPPLFEALDSRLPAGSVWQASHLGGHRFAPNVLVLPYGIQLGRLTVAEADAAASLLAAGRIPLDRYRGRTLYAAPVQAAEVALRRARGLDRIDDLLLLEHAGAVVRFEAAGREETVVVGDEPGPIVPVSCGAEPERTVVWRARVESAA